MDQILWSFDEVKPFLSHPEGVLRGWALDRLKQHFPDQAGEAVVPLLDDEAGFNSITAIEILGQTGETEKYGPVLLERLKQAKGRRFVALAEALANLGYREALPVILDYVQQEHRPSLWNEYARLMDVLVIFGGEAVHSTLWSLIHKFSPADYRIRDIMPALLEIARPDDVPALVQQYRAWPTDSAAGSNPTPFARVVRAEDLYFHLVDHWDDNVLIAMMEMSEWLGHLPKLDDACVKALKQAVAENYQGVFEILLDEARRFFKVRGDDISSWQMAWGTGQNPVGYRRRALLTQSILEAFVAAGPASDLQLRANESVLGLSMIFQFSLDRDDESRLEAAPDRTEMLFSILMEDREHVLPGIVDEVVGMGAVVVPRVLKLLKTNADGWGLARIVKIIGRMARSYPGEFDPAVPYLIQLIYEHQPDEFLEDLSEALTAIGPAGVPQVIEHLEDDDRTRQIYLTGVLGRIPVERSAQALLGQLGQDAYDDEMNFTYLAEIGSAVTIEPLYEIWHRDDEDEEYRDWIRKRLAQPLLVLCQLHGIEKPELPEWRALVAEEKAIMARIAAGEPDETFDLASAFEALTKQPGAGQQTSGATSKGKTGSTKKQKQKSTRSKKGKGKQKKKRRR